MQAQQCKPQLFSASHARQLLQRKHVTFMGESLIRHLAGTFAELLLDSNVTLPYLRPALHKDFNLPATCATKLEFLWRSSVRVSTC